MAPADVVPCRRPLVMGLICCTTSYHDKRAAPAAAALAGGIVEGRTVRSFEPNLFRSHNSNLGAQLKLKSRVWQFNNAAGPRNDTGGSGNFAVACGTVALISPGTSPASRSSRTTATARHPPAGSNGVSGPITPGLRAWRERWRDDRDTRSVWRCVGGRRRALRPACHRIS
jgi:hypothetical protein